MSGCQLAGLPDQHAYLDAVAAYAAEHPERPWITGEGWSMSAFPGGIGRASQLDELVSDRPVYLESRVGHSAWVNSAALAVARITRPRHPIRRTAASSATATAHPGGCSTSVPPSWYRAMPQAATAGELEAALLRAQSELQRRGIGAWQDADVTPEQQAAYLALVGRGQLSSRVALSLRWDASRDLRQVARSVGSPRGGGRGRCGPGASGQRQALPRRRHRDSHGGTAGAIPRGSRPAFRRPWREPVHSRGAAGHLHRPRPGALRRACARRRGSGRA